MKSRLTIALTLVVIALLLTPALASAQDIQIEPPSRTALGVTGPSITIEIEIDDPRLIIPCVRVSISGPDILWDPKTHVVTVVPPDVSIEVETEEGR